MTVIRAATYILCAISAGYGIVFLFKHEYRRLDRLWLPFFNIGAAIELVSFTRKPPVQWVLFYLGIALIAAGLLIARMAKQRAQKQNGLG